MIGPVTKNGGREQYIHAEPLMNQTKGEACESAEQYVHAESQEVIHKNDANGYCKNTEIFFLDNAALVVTTVAVMEICYTSHRLITRSHRLGTEKNRKHTRQTKQPPQTTQPTPNQQNVSNL